MKKIILSIVLVNLLGGLCERESRKKRSDEPAASSGSSERPRLLPAETGTNEYGSRSSCNAAAAASGSSQRVFPV